MTPKMTPPMTPEVTPQMATDVTPAMTPAIAPPITPAMITTAEVLRFEELTLNTAPARHQYFYDGWVLRASAGDARRSNSVTALYPSLSPATLPLDEKISVCEAWYARHGQTPMFRLSDALSPAGLDALLAARGYRREINTVVMTVSLQGLPAATAPAPGIRLVERSIGDGIADVHRMKGTAGDEASRDIERQKLWRGKEIFLSLRSINGLLACGMARIEAGHACIFSLRTPPPEQGKGYAQQLVAHLLAWGREQGAHTGFLQVDENNFPAIAVYRRFGFVARYPYWQRIGIQEQA